jgi:class 3 adenylate cyclase/tetratricopeptide (TPR) repeat protein
VLFADLVGFTSRAEQMDPEDVRALLAPYHQRLRSELERHGGTVEKFIGDAVVALFGAPVAHEDDPERAVRAGLAIRDWVREEGEDLQLRIAVNTGEALIALGARPEAGEGMASGDVVNTAARLQSAAPVNGILVGESTWRATRDRIDYEERDPVTAKGKTAPIAVWEPLQARSRFGMDLEQRVLTPLVGRERELGVVFDAFERARREREPQFVTLVGVPGIGKSRLVAELFQRIGEIPDLIRWRQGRALPYGAGVSFWALGEMVKAQTGINENDTPEAAREKLTRSVEQTIEEQDRPWVQRHLEPLLTLGDERATDLQEAFAAWRSYIEGLAEQDPLVLVFEDLHWADDGLLDFVDHLTDWASGVPLLVLATARPELLDRRPGWGGGKLNAVTLALSPLDDAEAARVIAAVLDQSVLPAETQAALLERAGGNPLYAEQFARFFLERGSLEDTSLPENVQGIIAARLDALSSEEKRVLQDAAVLGKVFWSGGVASLNGEQNLDSLLHSLERKGFVRRERRSAVAGETELAFRHVLVREVAYGQIPRIGRAEKHATAVAWIESLGRPDDHAELIAHHYSTALELIAAAGSEPAPELTERARHAFRRAADRALALNAFRPAEQYYGAALELWPDDDERPLVVFGLAKAEYNSGLRGARLTEAARDLRDAGLAEEAAEAHAIAANAAWHESRGEEVIEQLEQALALVEPLPPSPSKAVVYSEVARHAMLAWRNQEAVEYGQQALELADALDLPEVRVNALNNIGVARFYLGEHEGLAQLEQSIELANGINSPAVARGLHNLSTLTYMAGNVPRSLELEEQSITASARFGVAPLWRFAKAIRPGYLMRSGRWDDAVAAIEEVVAENADHPSVAIAAIQMRGWIRSARGDYMGALDDTARGLDDARRSGEGQSLMPSLALRAIALLRAGEVDAAKAIVLEQGELAAATALVPFAGPADIVDVWLTLVGSDVFKRTWESAAPIRTPWLEAAFAFADGDFDRAIEIYEATGSKTDAPLVRLRAAQHHVEAGRRAEADAYLVPALAFHRSVGAKHFVAQGEALLAATA